MTQEQPAPSAADFMTKHVHVVPTDMSLGDVVHFLLEHGISNAPVVERQDHKQVLIGFISECDCLEFLSNEVFYGLPAPLHTARTIMRRHPVCVSPDTELFTLASIFSNHGYRHLPKFKGAGYIFPAQTHRNQELVSDPFIQAKG